MQMQLDHPLAHNEERRGQPRGSARDKPWTQGVVDVRVAVSEYTMPHGSVVNTSGSEVVRSVQSEPVVGAKS